MIYSLVCVYRRRWWEKNSQSFRVSPRRTVFPLIFPRVFAPCTFTDPPKPCTRISRHRTWPAGSFLPFPNSPIVPPTLFLFLSLVARYRPGVERPLIPYADQIVRADPTLPPWTCRFPSLRILGLNGMNSCHSLLPHVELLSLRPWVVQMPVGGPFTAADVPASLFITP